MVGITTSTVMQYCQRWLSFPHLVSVEGTEKMSVAITQTRNAMTNPINIHRQHTATTTAGAISKFPK